MLPTSRWKLRQMLRKLYEDRIAYIEGNIKIQTDMAAGFLDEDNFGAASSILLLVEADKIQIEELKGKLELVSEDSCFEELYE
jgi:hypothetical protein